MKTAPKRRISESAADSTPLDARQTEQAMKLGLI